MKNVTRVAALWLAACAPTVPAKTPSSEPPAAAEPASEPAARAAAEPALAASTEPAPSQVTPYLVPVDSKLHAQSPINIESASVPRGKHGLAFHYKPSKEHVANEGHTVKMTYDAGSTLEFDGKSYDLVQFHFHTPSEHLLDGVTYPMELHLVHTEHGNPERFLVVGVLFKEGATHAALASLLANVPNTPSKVESDQMLDAKSFVGSGQGYFHYAGSLTTPPYTEAVTWLVLDQPHEAGADQIEALNRLEGNNARHIQGRHARSIDHGR